MLQTGVEELLIYVSYDTAYRFSGGSQHQGLPLLRVEQVEHVSRLGDVTALPDRPF